MKRQRFQSQTENAPNNRAGMINNQRGAEYVIGTAPGWKPAGSYTQFVTNNQVRASIQSVWRTSAHDSNVPAP